MWKIIKQQVDTVKIENKKFTLWMKWKFFIEFVSDRFGPYEYKFAKEDTYYSDGLQDRGSKIFPLKNKEFNNTELFFENDDIVVAVGKRWDLSGKEKYFVDLINLKTEKKYRIFTDEVSLIVLTDKWLLVNFNDNWVWKTIILNPETMEVVEEKEEKLDAFFKLIYNEKNHKWYVLDFVPEDNGKDNFDDEKFKHWVFILKEKSIKWEPEKFDRENWQIILKNWKKVDVWEESI